MTNTLAFSIDAFCKAHSMSRAMYYELQREGLGPRLIRIGRKPLITVEAAAEWRQRMMEMEGARQTEAA